MELHKHTNRISSSKQTKVELEEAQQLQLSREMEVFKANHRTDRKILRDHIKMVIINYNIHRIIIKSLLESSLLLKLLRVLT